ncbi:MAG TPA: rhodanese-like domain-containing protein, partial [Streptosporangiaceae bacterium]
VGDGGEHDFLAVLPAQEAGTAEAADGLQMVADLSFVMMLVVIGGARRCPAAPIRARSARSPVPAKSCQRAGQVVLDVRVADEYARGHLHGARHLPIGELPGRLAEIPGGRLWVHCQAGYRAGIAASLLDRADRDVILVDDDLSGALRTALPGRPRIPPGRMTRPRFSAGTGRTL